MRLYSVPGVESAAVSFAAGEAEITFDPRRTDAVALTSLVAEAGYAARVVSGDRSAR